MRPLFTVHAGEYLVGCHIEEYLKDKKFNVWIPSKDTGTDLLISDRQNRRTVSLQVKFSKDYLVSHMTPVPVLLENFRAFGWWNISQHELQASTVDFWVFVLVGFAALTTDFVIVPPMDFLNRQQQIQGALGNRIHSGLCVTKNDQCWEARGLDTEQRTQIAEGRYENQGRNFTRWLNLAGWNALVQKLQ